MSRDAPQILVSRVLGPGNLVPITQTIRSFEFEDDERKVDRASLAVDNFDLAQFDDPTWQRGNIFRLTWGYQGNLAPARDMIVKKVTGGKILNVELHDLAVVMDRDRRRQTFEHVTRSEVVRRIAEANGYRDATLHVEDVEERHETIVQSNLSDAQMLRKLAHLEGFEFWVDFDGLHWHRRKVDQTPIRSIVYYTSQVGDVIDFDVENDLTRKPGRVRVKGRDPIERADIDAHADDGSDKDRVVMMELVSIVDYENGTTIDVPMLRSAPKPQDPDANVQQESTRPSSAQTQADATREAKGRFRKTQQVAVRMTMEIVGDPQLVAKSVVELEGFGRRVSGKYYVSSAKHSLSTSGYTTSLRLITDGHGRGQKHGKGSGVDAGAAVGDGNAALLAALERLNVIYAAEATVLGVSLTDLTRRIVAQMRGLIPQANTPGRYAAMAHRMREVSEAGARKGATGTLEAAASFVAIAIQLSKGERVSAGKPNEKVVRPGNDLVPIERIDAETGTTYTEWVERGGRE